MASEISQQVIMETMKSLVSVEQDLEDNAKRLLFQKEYDDIMYQKMSEDWNLLDDSVFAVRIYLLLAS